MAEISIEESKMPFTSTPLGRGLKTAGAGLLGVVLMGALDWASNASNFTSLVSLVADPFYRSIATMLVASFASWAGRKAKESGKDLKVL